MRSKQFVWVAMLVLAGTTGCAMCDNAQDWSYAAFGGKWQRDNPTSGRVASLFDPAGAQIVEQGSPMEAEPAPESTEEAEESAKPLVEEPEAETAEPQMEEPKDEAADRQPAGGTLELPVMPGEATESPKPKDDDGLLPPLELPP